jgi:ribokinase
MGSSGAGGVLVFGSINVDNVFRVDDFPQPGETRAGGEVADSLGGKGSNQAVAAARQGARVAMVGCVGQDGGGDLALAELEAEGIDIGGCRRVPDVPTGRAGILVDRHGENMIVVADGANGELGADDARSAADQIGASRAVVAQLETPIPGVAEAFAVAREAGVETVLNAAPAKDLPGDLTRLIGVLIVNRVEAATLAGSGGDDAEADVRRLAEGFEAEVVVMTMGERGALVWHDAALRHVDAPRVDAVDTTGAGDAFVGAFAQAIANGVPPEPAARRACVAGALAATRPGAMPAMPRREQVDAELARR